MSAFAGYKSTVGVEMEVVPNAVLLYNDRVKRSARPVGALHSLNEGITRIISSKVGGSRSRQLIGGDGCAFPV